MNEETKKSYLDFKALVDFTRKNSFGELFGIGMKLPKDERFQFKVILRIFEKMFKKELTHDKVESIIAKIDGNIEKRQKESSKHIEIGDVVGDIMNTWTE